MIEKKCFFSLLIAYSRSYLRLSSNWLICFCSRNTAQKQWDETIVLVLGGIARLLRSFFPFLQQLSKFSSGKLLLHCLPYMSVICY